MFKKTRKIGKGQFIIEISKMEGLLIIGAFNNGSPENYIIELKEPNDEEIMKTFSHDFDLMCTNLDIVNKRLVLLNPVSIKK